VGGGGLEKPNKVFWGLYFLKKIKNFEKNGFILVVISIIEYGRRY
tara:strand:- start:298 stop:432 length:135 start_codon:yes stop_codon:yes gene_type:complete